MTDSLLQKIKSITEDRFKENDLSHCFFVDGQLNNKKLEVFIDGDKGVSFADCQKLSRTIEAYLDESKVLGEKYVLNVSSPGVEKPLKLKRQYPQHIGRTIEVLTKDEKKISGILERVDESSITIKTKKTKKVDAKEHIIIFDDLLRSKILISFKK